VVNWWRSQSPIYHTDRRYLCTTATRWAWGTARRAGLSAATETCLSHYHRLFACCFTLWVNTYYVSKYYLVNFAYLSRV